MSYLQASNKKAQIHLNKVGKFKVNGFPRERERVGIILRISTPSPISTDAEALQHEVDCGEAEKAAPVFCENPELLLFPPMEDKTIT